MIKETKIEMLSISESTYIKGIAIILMFMHHLFAFENRIPSGANIIYLFDSFNIEHSIGEYGKYCVPLFLFLSGYALAIKHKSDFKYYLKRAMNVYIAAWLVFLVFIPISYYVFDAKWINLEPRVFILNLLGILSTYNGEWWFLLPYVVLILITPLIQKNRKYIPSILIISFLLHNVLASGIWGEVLYWQSSYILGFFFGVHPISLAKYNKIFITIILCLIIILGYNYFNMESMVFLVPCVVFILKFIYSYTPKIIKLVINELGHKSLFLWLIHSFYAYGFLKDFIYYPKYTALILLNLVFCSYITAKVFDVIYKRVVDKINVFYS